MAKSPIAATIVALVLATIVNVYYFTTATELSVVVGRTLFVDMLLVLTLVPVYQAILIKPLKSSPPLPEMVKSGMKPVAMYTFLLAIITFILFKLFGDPLVGERLFELGKNLDQAIADGTIKPEQKTQQLEMAKQIYSPSSHVLIALIGNLFTGFVSSILAGFLIRK